MLCQFYRPIGHTSDKTVWAVYHLAELELPSVKIILRHLFMHSSRDADGTQLSITAHFLQITAYTTLLSVTCKSAHSDCHACAQWWNKLDVRSIWLKYGLWIKHATWSAECIKELYRSRVVYPWADTDTVILKKTLELCTCCQWCLNSLKYICNYHTDVATNTFPLRPTFETYIDMETMLSGLKKRYQ